MRQYFLKPREAVQQAIDSPSIPKMVAFLLLPNIVIFLITLALTFQFNAMDLIYGTMNDAIWLICASVILVILTSLFSRQMVSLHFLLGIATALSLNGIYRSVIYLIGYLAFPLLVFPDFVQQFQLYLQGNIGTEEAVQAFTSMMQNFSTMQFIVSIVLLLVMGIFFLYTMYIYYLSISRTMKSQVIIHFIIMVISLLALNFVLSFI